MKANVGGLDRAARIVLGVALIVMAATGVVGLWGYVGAVLVATGVIRFCPLYPLLGVNTCPTRKAS
jgi:NADH:ubiquinone oxidoreductase subunit 4 (subunit M)